MKALKGSAEEKSLVQRYTQQLNEQENRLEALRKEVAKIGKQAEEAQAVLDRPRRREPSSRIGYPESATAGPAARPAPGR